MKICAQCGEGYLVGGFASIPGQDLFDKERCLNCLLFSVRQFNPAAKDCLIMKPKERPNADAA